MFYNIIISADLNSWAGRLEPKSSGVQTGVQTYQSYILHGPGPGTGTHEFMTMQLHTHQSARGSHWSLTTWQLQGSSCPTTRLCSQPWCFFKHSATKNLFAWSDSITARNSWLTDTNIHRLIQWNSWLTDSKKYRNSGPTLSKVKQSLQKLTSNCSTGWEHVLNLQMPHHPPELNVRDAAEMVTGITSVELRQIIH